MASGQFLHQLGLLLHAGGRTMELHQQHGFFPQGQLGVRVHHAHGVLVDQLHTRNRNPHLNDLNRGAHRRFNAGEPAHSRADGFGQRVELDGDFGDDAQRAFTAHHQPRQVIPGRRLFGPRARANHAAAGGHHLQRQHVFTHSAVAHGVGPAGARGTHTAQCGVGAWINREEQSGAFDGFIELLAGHAGLNRHRQVFGIDLQHLVHAAHVQADAALHRQQVPFKRRAHAKRDHRHMELTSQRHRVGHVLRVFCKHHGRRRRGVEGRLIPPVLLTHHLGGGAVGSKAALQRGDEGGGNVARGNIDGQKHGQASVHGNPKMVHVMDSCRNRVVRARPQLVYK